MIMGWMADEYASIQGQAAPAVITGKPIALGGSVGREDATARGGFYLTCHLTERLGLPTEGLRVVVQGFGNAGQHAARLFRSIGAKIVAVSDSGAPFMRPPASTWTPCWRPRRLASRWFRLNTAARSFRRMN